VRDPLTPMRATFRFVAAVFVPLGTTCRSRRGPNAALTPDLQPAERIALSLFPLPRCPAVRARPHSVDDGLH